MKGPSTTYIKCYISEKMSIIYTTPNTNFPSLPLVNMRNGLKQVGTGQEPDLISHVLISKIGFFAASMRRTDSHGEIILL